MRIGDIGLDAVYRYNYVCSYLMFKLLMPNEWALLEAQQQSTKLLEQQLNHMHHSTWDKT